MLAHKGRYLIFKPNNVYALSSCCTVLTVELHLFSFANKLLIFRKSIMTSVKQKLPSGVDIFPDFCIIYSQLVALQYFSCPPVDTLDYA